jgi:hypothetical protein
MAYTFQVAVDSSDPHALADWWAQALHWDVEPSNEDFIRTMIGAGHASESDTKTHRGVLVWRAGQAINNPDGGAPRVLFQLVPEAKTVKNRMHLDIRVGEENVETEVERLTAAGARELWRGRQGPHWWVTMADPEDNEFCVS